MEFYKSLINSERFEKVSKIMKSQRAQQVAIGLIVIDFVLCQLAVFGCFYDTALPSVVSESILHLGALQTNRINWTIYRTILFSFSAILRITALFELFTRVFTAESAVSFFTSDEMKETFTSKKSDFGDVVTGSRIEIFDAFMVFLLFLLRFTLPLRVSLIYNNLVFLRFVRLYKYVAKMIDNSTLSRNEMAPGAQKQLFEL